MYEHKAEIAISDLVFPEGLRWHDGQLWFSDMWDFKVLRADADGTCQVVAEVPERPSGLGFLTDGTPIVVSMANRQIYRVANAGLEPFADLSTLATGDANDMIVADDGWVYVGNFGYDLFGGAEFAAADIISISPQGVAGIATAGLTFPNGMVLLDGGKTLVVAETWANRLTAFTRDADGSLSNRRVFAELGERTPDGLCSDAEDGVWVASFDTGEMVRVVDGGETTDIIKFPGKRAVACALGGADGRQLYCATYAGPIEDIHTRKRLGAIEVATVRVPARK